MRNKYYIPTIEEFHVGFEFEIFYQKGTYDMRDVISVADGGTGLPKFIPSEPNKEWHSDFIPLSGSDSHYWHYPLAKIQEVIDRKHIRVKYLDEEDVFALGFIRPMKEQPHWVMYINKDMTRDGSYVYMLFYEEAHNIIFEYYAKGISESIKVFEGTIKNKSELKVLMQQLKIEL